MSKEIARQEAIRLALAKLEHVDLISRCMELGFPVPENGNSPAGFW